MHDFSSLPTYGLALATPSSLSSMILLWHKTPQTNCKPGAQPGRAACNHPAPATLRCAGPPLTPGNPGSDQASTSPPLRAPHPRRPDRPDKAQPTGPPPATRGPRPTQAAFPAGRRGLALREPRVPSRPVPLGWRRADAAAGRADGRLGPGMQPD